MTMKTAEEWTFKGFETATVPEVEYERDRPDYCVQLVVGHLVAEWYFSNPEDSKAFLDSMEKAVGATFTMPKN